MERTLGSGGLGKKDHDHVIFNFFYNSESEYIVYKTCFNPYSAEILSHLVQVKRHFFCQKSQKISDI